MPVLRPRKPKALSPLASSSSNSSNSTMSHPRRAAAAASTTKRPQTPTSSVTIDPKPFPSDESKKSIRLTVKMPSNKLRQATSSTKAGAIKTQIAVNSRDTFEPGEILSGPRGSRAKRTIVEDSDSDRDEEVDEDAYGEEDEDMEALGEEDDAQGESDADADADAEAEADIDHPPPPPSPKIKTKPSVSKPKVIVTPAKKSKTAKSIESRKVEMADGSDDELSSLDSVDGEDGVQEEEAMQEGGEDEDAQGEPDEDAEGEDEQEQEDSDELSTSATPANISRNASRASTPDLSKMTKRQRSRLDEVMNMDLLELPSEAKQKKILSAEEHAMRRTEMARRRKNLSEQRNEEEKMETINKLLKKQAPKQQRRAPPPRNDGGEMVGTPGSQGGDGEERWKPNKRFIRWISDRDGMRVGVPEEWLSGGELARASGFEAQTTAKEGDRWKATGNGVQELVS